MGRDAVINGIFIVQEDFTSMSADPFYQVKRLRRSDQGSRTLRLFRVLASAAYLVLVHGNLALTR